MTRWLVVSLSLALSCVTPLVRSQSLTNDQLNGVKARLAEGAKQSWELGTRAEALTESETPSYSVLNDTSLPPSTHAGPNSLSDVFAIAKSVVANRSTSNGNIQGPQPFIKDGAAGDPASIGVAVLLANWTGRSSEDGVDYAGAAKDQLDYLLTQVPRTSDGAISHRVAEVQVWSDFVYMAPPFLAYYGVLSGNQSLVEEAYNQVKLYRQYLLDSSAGGLWKHIVMGSGTDPGHWSTGNGWAAAGMLRVLGTIQHSQYSKKMKNEMNDLQNWVTEILGGMYNNVKPNGLFTNYADNSTTFDDASSTALIASATYRLALLTGIYTHLPDAERSRKGLSAPSDSNGSLAHFTSDMWLTPVANPYSYSHQGTESPEGQAFVVEMQAAWGDWVAQGSPSANHGVKLCVGPWVTLAASCVGLILMLS